MTSQHLHPQSMRDLRQLVKLHGADAIVAAVRSIEREPVDIADNFKPHRPVADWHDWTQPPEKRGPK